VTGPALRRRRRRRLFAAAALAIGFVAAVALAEFALSRIDVVGRNYATEMQKYVASAIRFAWDGPTPTEAQLDGWLFRHRPGLDLDLGSFRLRTNQLGFRGPEVQVPKPAGVFRILLLGDSVAFGWGVNDDVTFARRLEREWNADPQRRPIEVVNTGHPQYDTCQQEATLREFLPMLAPDLVLLVYVVNDVDPTRDVVEAMCFGKQPDPAETVVVPDDGWSWSSRQLAPLLPRLAELIGAYTDLDARTAKMLPPGESYPVERMGKGPRGWPRSQRALLSIRDQCRAANAPLLVFDHTRPPIRSLEPFCRDQGIALEPLRFSADDFAGGITLSMLDAHANAKGHELLLVRMRDILVARGLLPR